MSRSIIIGALALLLLALGPVFAILELFAPLTASRFVLYAAILGILAVVVGLWSALKGRRRSGWVGVVLGLVALAPLVFTFASGSRYPPINDVTTDTEDPPAFRAATRLPENAGRDFDYGPELAKTVREAYPDVRPFYAMVPVDEAFQAALEAARAQAGWEIIHVDPDAHTIEAVATTDLFRFRDDVVIRVRDDEGSARIDVRSKSRVGRGDLGANAQRIREYLREVGLRLG